LKNCNNGVKFFTGAKDKINVLGPYSKSQLELNSEFNSKAELRV